MNLTNEVKKRIRLIYGIALSALLVVTGILFIISCYSIYESGDSPFTRASIGAAFSRIAVPTYVTLILATGSIVLGVVMPDEEGRLVGLRAPRVITARLARMVDVDALDSETGEKIRAQRRKRSILTCVNLALLILSSTLPLIYLLDPDNFPAVSGEYNTEILHGMLVYLAFLAPLAIYEAVYVILTDASYKREAELLKEAMKLGAAAPRGDGPKTGIAMVKEFFKRNEGPITLGVRIALVGCAIFFIIAGIINGGMTDVLNKAINICTECIGLG